MKKGSRFEYLIIVRREVVAFLTNKDAADLYARLVGGEVRRITVEGTVTP